MTVQNFLKDIFTSDLLRSRFLSTMNPINLFSVPGSV